MAVPPPAPGDWPRPVKPDTIQERCTPWLLPPGLDTVATALLLSLAYVERNSPGAWTPLLLAGASVPTGASAIYGYVIGIQCRRYQQLFLDRPLSRTR